MATPWASAYHAPVLAAEVLDFVGDAASAVDGTLGGGGTRLAMLEHGVRSVIGIDRDAGAIAAARDRLATYERDGRFRAITGNYADPDVLAQLGDDRFDAILLDLGVSSRQLDAEDRGFTFREGAPLDMRMDPTADLDAATWLSTVDEKELATTLREYGDEPKARRMAREIVRRRANRPFETSDDLVGAIRGALGPRSGPGDFARIFQAVRIAVNDELTGALDRAARAARPPHARRPAHRHRLPLRRRPHREARLSGVERGLHLPAQAAHLHLPRRGTWGDPDPEGDRRHRGRNGRQCPSPKRPTPRMAKRPVGSVRGGSKKAASPRGRIVLVLVGFVLVAIGVNLRRVYGFGQAKRISELQQRREALISEQLKLQDAIRVASDRQHLIAIAQSRLNMRLPRSRPGDLSAPPPARPRA